MAAKNLIIINPAAQSGKAAHLIPLMHELYADTSHELVVTEAAGHAKEIVLSKVGPDTGAVISVGGDGTVSEVINGLMRLDEGVRPALGIFSGGSGNDAAKGFGVPANTEDACKVLRAGHTRVFDAGLVNDRYFAGSFSIGLDALVVAKTLEYKATKGWSGERLYYSALLNVILTQLKPIELDINYRDAEGSEFSKQANVLLSATTNGKTYGGGIPINPDACPDDGFLTLSWVDSLSLPATLMRLPLIVKGHHKGLKAYHMSHITSASLKSSNGEPLIAQTDGELFSAQKFSVSVLKDALRVIVP